MFQKVLVGVDGGPRGRDAVALARRLVAPDGRITLGHVHGGTTSLLPSTILWNDWEVSGSERVLDEERHAAGDDVDSAAITASNPGEGLHRLAERLHSDLLVVGSSARAHLSRVLMGDDARAALNGAPCAVATAPVRYAQEGVAFERIGLGYDGSPESAEALETARVLAVRSGGRIEVVEAVQMPVIAAPGPWDEVITDLTAVAEERLAALPDVERSVVKGSPVKALRALGDRVDLLVVGSRSYGPLKRTVLGSTALDLQREVRCPLLVVPRASLQSGGAAAGESTAGATGG